MRDTGFVSGTNHAESITCIRASTGFRSTAEPNALYADANVSKATRDTAGTIICPGRTIAITANAISSRRQMPALRQYGNFRAKKGIWHRKRSTWSCCTRRRNRRHRSNRRSGRRKYWPEQGAVHLYALWKAIHAKALTFLLLSTMRFTTSNLTRGSGRRCRRP